jgi:Tol biopolymer transport system component
VPRSSLSQRKSRQDCRTSRWSCTNAAWSADGKWIYLTLHGKDSFHIWRQRFPNGQPEQISSGPTEEEGISLAPDGRSLITSVGLRQRTVSVHYVNNDRRISLEGYAYWPSFSPDGKKLYYRVLKGGTSPMLGASELWVADIASGRNDPLLGWNACSFFRKRFWRQKSSVDRSNGPKRRSAPDSERGRGHATFLTTWRSGISRNRKGLHSRFPHP